MTLTSGCKIGMHDAMMMVEPSTLEAHVRQRFVLAKKDTTRGHVDTNHVQMTKFAVLSVLQS